MKCVYNMHTPYTEFFYNADVQRVKPLKKHFKGSHMKKVIISAVVALGLGLGFAYAENTASTILEHANKTATGPDASAGDMSKMKAAGKCNADQSGKMKSKMKKPARKPTKAELELEHANKLPTGPDSFQGNMKNMKAQGKCNSGK